MYCMPICPSAAHHVVKGLDGRGRLGAGILDNDVEPGPRLLQLLLCERQHPRRRLPSLSAGRCWLRRRRLGRCRKKEARAQSGMPKEWPTWVECEHSARMPASTCIRIWHFFRSPCLSRDAELSDRFGRSQELNVPFAARGGGLSLLPLSRRCGGTYPISAQLLRSSCLRGLQCSVAATR